jgi:predicted transcriptional regulator/ribosome-binding protein aMBF1 (putative translation factor)
LPCFPSYFRQGHGKHLWKIFSTREGREKWQYCKLLYTQSSSKEKQEKKTTDMTGTHIGRIIRRLRHERNLTQQALAGRLGISTSYLNLIEHDQRAVTAPLLIKLTRILDVSIETLSGIEEHRLEAQLLEALADPTLGGQSDIPAHELAVLATQPTTARAILSLYKTARAARRTPQDAQEHTAPIILPQDELRQLYETRNNYFEELESFAESIRHQLARDKGLPEGETLPPYEINRAVASRLRHHHGIVVHVGHLDGKLKHYDPSARILIISEQMPRESRGFLLCSHLMLLEANAVMAPIIHGHGPISKETDTFMRLGLANYAAAALLMPYMAFVQKARTLRYDIENLSAHFGVSFHQAAHRLTSLQKPGERGIPFFFVRVDPAGNIIKSFSACGFPILQQGNPCPRWNACTAFQTPGRFHVDIVKFTNGKTFLTFARTITGARLDHHQAPPISTIAMGCSIDRAEEIIYADRLNLQAQPSPIGLTCHLCDWTDCRSRAFPYGEKNHPMPYELITDQRSGSGNGEVFI